MYACCSVGESSAPRQPVESGKFFGLAGVSCATALVRYGQTKRIAVGYLAIGGALALRGALDGEESSKSAMEGLSKASTVCLTIVLAKQAVQPPFQLASALAVAGALASTHVSIEQIFPELLVADEVALQPGEVNISEPVKAKAVGADVSTAATFVPEPKAAAAAATEESQTAAAAAGAAAAAAAVAAVELAPVCQTAQAKVEAGVAKAKAHGQPEMVNAAAEAAAKVANGVVEMASKVETKVETKVEAKVVVRKALSREELEQGLNQDASDILAWLQSESALRKEQGSLQKSNVLGEWFAAARTGKFTNPFSKPEESITSAESDKRFKLEKKISSYKFARKTAVERMDMACFGEHLMVMHNLELRLMNQQLAVQPNSPEHCQAAWELRSLRSLVRQLMKKADQSNQLDIDSEWDRLIEVKAALPEGESEMTGLVDSLISEQLGALNDTLAVLFFRPQKR